MEVKNGATTKNSIAVQSYIFRAELEQEQDGRWSAWIDVLPGCAVWGHSKEEALDALKEAAQAYLEVIAEKKKPVFSRKTVETVNAPLIAVTL